MTTGPRPLVPDDEPGAEAAVRALVERSRRLGALSMEQLWLRYFAIGGDVGLVELEAYLAGLMPLPALQRDLLATAVNERLDEVVTASQVPLSRTTRPGRPPAGPLTALVDLLDDAHRAPPERLAEVAAAAGRALDVDVGIYLVDHDQRLLVPVPDLSAANMVSAAPTSATRLGGPDIPTEAALAPLRIDSTLAGRAFQTVQTVAGDTAGAPRLWVPLVDGVERLGVLDVRLHDPGDLADPGLREQCLWFASLLGHLVVGVGKYGDALDAVRRREHRTVAAELTWQLLPPPTSGTRSFLLSGWLEPSSTVGGDTFDYALSDTTVSLAVFDAMGHGLQAGLMSAVAVSAYRSARRNGVDLPGQLHAVDRTVAEQFGDGRFVTGFLGELDLSSGRLRYASAGHPEPLLLRAGRVVKTLAHGRRLPFGLGQLRTTPSPGGDAAGAGCTAGEDLWTAPRLGEEDLQPGDWLAVYTDGVTEARDAQGSFFGEARLTDLLERAAAAGQPPPETARRLAHAVLDHQDGKLQDDATVLLGCWQHR